MRILFDHGTPEPLIPFLVGHAVTTAKVAGWDKLSNGLLLTAAEQAGFELLITTDKRMQYQQNFTDRMIALVVLGNSSWPVARQHVDKIVMAVNACTPGSYVEVEIPFR
jgi:hypothetical protein